jgi:hypothetical protein
MWEPECHGWTDKFQLFFLVSMYECHGWTDKFQLFSFSSVAYSQVSLSVRTEVPTKKKKRKKHIEQTQKHRSDRVIHSMAKKIKRGTI